MMKFWMIFLGALLACLIGCNQGPAGVTSYVKSLKLTCLVLGYDSVIYYQGTSDKMEDINKGKLTDTAFVGGMFAKIKNGGLAMILKPGGGEDMVVNFKDLANLAGKYKIKPSVDSGDVNEDKAFGFVTPPMVRAAMRGEKPPPLKLDLPRDPDSSNHALSSFPKAAQLTILISGGDNLYAYMGGEMRKSKKYSYEELTALLKARNTDKDFSVMIRPAKSSSYKSIVNLLDVMKTAGIKHYALVDITKEEEDYLQQVYP